MLGSVSPAKRKRSASPSSDSLQTGRNTSIISKSPTAKQIVPSTNMFNPNQAQASGAHPEAQRLSVEETKQKYLAFQQMLQNEMQQFGPNHPRGIEAAKKLETFKLHMGQFKLQQQQQQQQQQAAMNGMGDPSMQQSHVAAALAAQQFQQQALLQQQKQAHAQAQMQAHVQAQQANQQSPQLGVQTTASNPSGGILMQASVSSSGTNNPSQGAPSTGPMKLLAPPNLQGDAADIWRRDAEVRLRTAHTQMVHSRTQIQQTQAYIQQHAANFTPEEAVLRKTQLDQYLRQYKKCKEFIESFRTQQAQLAAQLRQAQQGNGINTGIIPSAQVVNNNNTSSAVSDEVKMTDAPSEEATPNVNSKITVNTSAGQYFSSINIVGMLIG